MEDLRRMSLEEYIKICEKFSKETWKIDKKPAKYIYANDTDWFGSDVICPGNREISWAFHTYREDIPMLAKDEFSGDIFTNIF